MNALLRVALADVEAAVAIVCVYLALRLVSCCINFTPTRVLEPAWALLLLLPH